jgi:hypothetical protein
LVRVKYKDILVIPLDCVPETFVGDTVFDTMNAYLEYVNITGVMPLHKNVTNNPFVLTFKSEWLSKTKV